jgi:uncharacterized protein
MQTLLAAFLLALGAFAWVFLGSFGSFWLRMSLAVGTLTAYALAFEGRAMLKALLPGPRAMLRALALGLLSAALLYAVFYFGNMIAGSLLPFARDNIDSVYALKEGSEPLIIALLIAIVIAPGEEIFWRAFIQRRLAGRLGWPGLLWATAAYTAVHFATGNVMLIIAALVCGLFWGLLYQRFNSLWANIFSHIIWDLAVFIFWPFT